MKRVQPSGSENRKKKKAKEEEQKRSAEAMKKFVTSKSSSSREAPNEEIDSSLEACSQEVIVDPQQTNPSRFETGNVPAIVPTQSAHEVGFNANNDSQADAEVVTGEMGESSINLKDVGQWPMKLSDGLRVLLVRQGSTAVQHLDSNFAKVARPGLSTKGEARRLTQDWFYRKLPNGEKILRTWMVYSPSKSSLFCFCCKLFGTVSGPQSAFSSRDGFCKWWKLNPKVEEHESSQIHGESFEKWKNLEIGISRGTIIDKVEQEVIQKEEKRWREVLYRLLDIIRFLAKQNLALRGHREYEDDSTEFNRGNFLELVHLLAKYDPVLREHLTKVKLGSKHAVSYMSPQIQNEFINILGDQVRQKIFREVQEAKYFCMIFDSTPDISRKDQTSQILRYVKIDGPRVEIVESFVDFIETREKNAEDLTAMILTKISKDGLDIQNCRGQAYDNAAVMAGVHTGVQARIKSINPKAQFVACTNHSLNLAGIHAASETVQSVTFFGTIEKVFVFFSSSTHRWGILTAVTGQGVKRLIETRWSARTEAVEAFKNHFSDILDVLEKLASDTNENIATRSEAGLLLKALQSFSFLCYLGLWSQVLKEVNDAQNYLQTKGLNVEQCATKVRALQEFLVGNRDSLVDNAFSYAKKLCDDLLIDLEPRRRRIRNDIFGNGSQGAVLSYEDELRREMYTSLDRIIQEMTSRFQQIQDLSKKFSFLTPTKLLDPQYVCDLGGVSDEIDQAEFLVERQRLQQFIGASDRHESLTNKGPLELLRFIQEFSLGISVPNIVIMLRLFLTIAISVASCERSFSKLKLIKNYLRSTMTQLRLSNLAILSIEQTITNRLSFDDAIKEFATRKARKIFL